MKNILISVLATYIILDLPIWRFDGGVDAILVAVAMVGVLFIILESVEYHLTNAIRSHRRKKRKYERFLAEIDEAMFVGQEEDEE